MIHRQLLAHLRRLSTKFPVVTVTGPRQSGKSTLAKAAFPGYQCVNLEDPESRAFARSDPKGFLRTYGSGTILDEIQRVPDLLSSLQVLVDEEDNPGMYVLTGSQNLQMAEAVSQSLAGRTAVLTLLPLSTDELAEGGFRPTSMEDWIFRGGYPRLFVSDIAPTDFFPSYIETYLERDVRNLKNIGDLSTFQTFVQLLAGRTGQMLNYSSISQETGIAVNTAKAWVSLLEATFIVFRLRPHFRNYSKRLVKTPKIYFYDTGLACALMGIRDVSHLSAHPLRGGIFETAVVSDIVKTYHHRSLRPPVYFWRDLSGHEVDCIVEDGPRLLPIEIKSGRTIGPEFFSGLATYSAISGTAGGLVVYGGDSEQQRTGIPVVSWRSMASRLPLEGLAPEPIA